MALNPHECLRIDLSTLRLMDRDAFSDIAPASTFHDAKAYRREMRTHFDPRVGELAIDRIDARFSNDQLIRASNAGPHCLRKLSGREFDLHRSGGILGRYEKLYSVPKGHRCPVGRNRIGLLKSGKLDASEAERVLRQLDEWTPTTIWRFDVDHHDGTPKQTLDAETLIERINRHLFDGQAYVERSPRGIAVYAILVLPKREWHGDASHLGTSWYVDSAERQSDSVKAAQRTLRAWAKSEGLSCGVDLQGGPTVFDYDRPTGRVKRIVRRGTLMRMPKCRRPGDVARFAASRFGYDEVRSKLDRLTPPEARHLQPLAPTRAKGLQVATQGIPSKRSGDFLADNLRCVRKAITDRFGSQPSRLTEDGVAMARDHAMNIYESLGLNQGIERDAKRIQRFDRLVRYCLANNDPSKAGSGGNLFFVEDDVQASESYLRSIVAEAGLGRHLASFDRADGSNKIGKLNKAKFYRILAIAACTFAKNAFTGRRGEVPASSVEGMLRQFGHNVNGSTISFLTAVLERIGLITKVADAAFGKCRKWTVSSRLIRTLPFMSKVNAERIAEQTYGAQEQAEVLQYKKDGYKVVEPNLLTDFNALEVLRSSFDLPIATVDGRFSRHSPLFGYPSAK